MFNVPSFPAALGVAAAVFSVCAAAQSRLVEFDIEAQPLPAALLEFSRSADVSIIAAGRLTAGKHSPGVRGEQDVTKALNALLEGTGLTAREQEDGAYVLTAETPTTQVAPSKPSTSSRGGTSPSRTDHYDVVDTVIVTANRREQDTLDVPVAVTSISGEQLLRFGSDRKEEYLALAPGVEFGQNGLNTNLITIRGIQTALFGSNQQATVEVFYDEMPSLNRLYARHSSDLRLVDVERVEVLRGPQGTLFGSGAMGGAVKIINRKPDASRLEANFDTSLATTDGGSGSYDVKGTLNLPLVDDVLALRGSMYSFHEGGFIDNVVRAENNVDDVDTRGARVMLEYAPDERLTALLTGTYQDDESGAASIALLDSSDGDRYTIDTPKPERAFDGVTRVLNLAIDYDFEWAKLVSSTSYYSRDGRIARDWTEYWQGTVRFDGPVTDVEYSETETYSQELRLASAGEGRLQWLAGMFYTDQDVLVDFLRTQVGSEQAIGAPDDVLSHIVIAPKTREIAFFGELSYDVTQHLTLTTGARWFENRADFSSSRSGYLSGRQTPPRSTREDAVTPKFAALYRFNDRLSVYAQATQGYRVGQNNFSLIDDPASGFVPPAYFESDSLWNYELGLKTVAAGWLHLNAAVYYIDWSDIQFTVGGSTGTFTDNAGMATSKGFELELQGRPTDWLELGLAVAYTDATLDSVAEDVSEAEPGRLPGSTEWASREFVQFNYRGLIGDGTTYLRLAHQYTGEKAATLGRGGFDPVGITTDAYSKIDLRAGFATDRYDVSLFVDNLTNDDASLAPRRIPFTADATTRLRPRTVGVGFRFTY